MAIRSFKDLIVWQRSIDLIDEIYRLTQRFPKSETYGLSSQIQRAAVSVAANIAEGNGRDSTKEYIHHLSFSLGSLAEVETYFVVCMRLGYASAQAVTPLEVKADEIGRMIRSLQKALRSKLRRDKDNPESRSP
ncbi:MAG TPA: four helix bundle protein [Pirellulaceae bacterium]|nr:four helix bundle protein [Pirellulaceae bacterium]